MGPLLLSLLFSCAPDQAPLSELAQPAAAGSTEDVPDEGGPAPIPDGANLYALDVPFRTHLGTTGGIDVARGHPVLFSMFYTTCPMACPLLIQDIQALEATLAPEVRAGLRVVLVSLDPARDDLAALRGVVETHHLDDRWVLGAVPDDSVRDVAAALGVRYRPLPDGNFAHTAVLTLVDGTGRIVARSEGPEGRVALLDAIAQQAAR